MKVLFAILTWRPVIHTYEWVWKAPRFYRYWDGVGWTYVFQWLNFEVLL